MLKDHWVAYLWKSAWQGALGAAVAFGLLMASPASAQPPGPTDQPAAATEPTVAIPIAPLPAPKSGVFEITVRNMGVAGAASQGTEVWLQYAVGDSTVFPGALFRTSQGWISRDGFLISTGDSDPLTYTGELNGVAGLVFFRHPWSGKVEVTINGVAQTIDLYAPSADSATVPLSGDPVIFSRPVDSPPPPPPPPPAQIVPPESAPATAVPDTEVIGEPATANDASLWMLGAGIGAGILVIILIGVVLTRRRKA